MTLVRLAAALAATALLTGTLHAQDKGKGYEPQVGQAGKDVIWVPTPDEVVDRMLKMAQVKADDYVVDLGAGNGKIAIAAAKNFGARAMGIEYNPDMAKHAQENAVKAGVQARAKIVQGDIFQSDFTQATVITMYLLPALNLKLRPQILSMKPGTRIVSHSFTMDDWEADEISSFDGRRAYFWVVPANVMGSWTLDAAGAKSDITLEQRYQKIEGQVTVAPSLQAGLREPKLSGYRISFAIVDNAGVRRDFTGTVTGNRMEGGFKADNGTEGRWTAAKK